MSPESKATRIVGAIWADLCDRSGFDLGTLDDDTQDEIRRAWKELVMREIKSKKPARAAKGKVRK